MKLPETFVKGSDNCINIIVETPKGSRNKFAYDPETGFFQLKKILPAGTAFPLDFGFIPGTKGEDGDPLDALVLMEQTTYPGCLLECRLIGVIKGEQRDKGEKAFIRNDRFVAVPLASADYKKVLNVQDFGDDRMTDLIHFFQYYRGMSGGEYKLVGKGDANEAIKLVKEGK